MSRQPLRSVQSGLLARLRNNRPETLEPVAEPAVASFRLADLTPVLSLDLDIAPNDPLLAYFQGAGGAVELHRLRLQSPALEALRAEGVALVVPLVSQGELIGLINLGSRMSEQEYSSDDRKLMGDLASQAAPAVRVAQLVRQQQVEARERERIEQELKVARIIQQTLLPKELPELPGYAISAYWQPARAVGGDFYDFIPFPDGRIGIVIADVTDKGVPAALVMATTRSILRAAAERLIHPGKVLERTNDVLQPDMPPKMFVTCLYALLEPATGRLCYANAGHNLPFRRCAAGANELRATGMPLGLLPGMDYEEKETFLEPGDQVVFYTDGLVEAHNARREMFGTPRLQHLLGLVPTDHDMVSYLLQELNAFTGPDWEQEDDVTFVTLIHEQQPVTLAAQAEAGWEEVSSFQLESVPGNERQAMQRVEEIVAPLGLLSGARLEKLKTAVAEATMNAMEHGNQYQPDLPVAITVLRSPDALAVRIVDQGGSGAIADAPEPDIEAKLAGLQSPRGWGLFLIRSMVDALNVAADDSHHTLELLFTLQGD